MDRRRPASTPGTLSETAQVSNATIVPVQGKGERHVAVVHSLLFQRARMRNGGRYRI